jgi:hypothetical protein
MISVTFHEISGDVVLYEIEYTRTMTEATQTLELSTRMRQIVKDNRFLQCAKHKHRRHPYLLGCGQL